MRVPVEWLKAFVSVRLSAEALAKRLTMAGLEVVDILTVEGQPVLDLEITPNRADCLSIIGIAREVAAVTGAHLKLPQQPPVSTVQYARGRAATGSPRVTIRIEDRKGCQRYIGRLIEGVRVDSSPAWMRRRLIACGARPINTLVDTTNYVLFEYGQPLHAFDFDRLAGGTILVRRARANESITTLDGIARTLSLETLVIADARRAVAVAGVMGGVGSEVTSTTTHVLLESALFDPATVRRTARQLGCASESSYRFERGVDPEGVEAASARATALICSLAGGRLLAIREAGIKPSGRKTIILESHRLNRWLGVSWSPATIRSTLAKASFRVGSSDESPRMRVSVPSFRRDVAQEVDLYEEVARLVGYERIPSRLPVAPVARPSSEAMARYQRLQFLRRVCAGLGLAETVSWAFVSEADLSRCAGAAEQAVRLANPLSRDHAFLRPSLVIGLLQTIRRNLSYGALGIRIFELGHAVVPDVPPTETQRLGIALCGEWSRDWNGRQPCDFFRLKGIVETVVEHTRGGCPQATPLASAWIQPGHGAQLTVNGRSIGMIGQVLRGVRQAFDIDQDVWVAELWVDELLAFPQPTVTASPPPAFPPVKRDLSMVVDSATPVASIAAAIREVGSPLADSVELIDRYTAGPIPTGRHSLTFSIAYRDAMRTLTAPEVDALHHRIAQTLTSRFGATLRA